MTHSQMPREPLLPLLAGAGSGAVVTALPYLIEMPGLGLAILIGSSIVWAAGAILIGWPVWIALERFDLRSRWAASLAGAGAASAPVLAIWASSGLTGPVDKESAVLAGVIVVGGGVAGFVVRQLAYGDKTPPTDDDIVGSF